MGHFCNGTEGEWYRDTYCASCLHIDKCSVWLAHMLYNSDQTKNPAVKGILDLLIPVTKDRSSNLKCSMHLEKKDGIA